MGKNKVTFGLSSVHVAEVTESEGNVTYGVPFAVPGAVSMNVTPENEEIRFEADNDPNYFAAFGNNGYKAELAMAAIPDEFKEKFLGYKKDSKGLVVEDVTSVGKPFALLFEIQGDTEAVRFVYYKCTGGRPSFAPKTGKQPEAQTIPMTIGKPVGSDYILAYARKSENATAYNAWFNSVQKFSTV